MRVCNIDSEPAAPWMWGCSLIQGKWDVSSLSLRERNYQLWPLKVRDTLAAEEPRSDSSMFRFEQDCSNNFPNSLVGFLFLSTYITLLPSYFNFRGTTQRNFSYFQVQIFGHLITICLKANYMCWECFKAVSSPGFGHDVRFGDVRHMLFQCCRINSFGLFKFPSCSAALQCGINLEPG